MFKSIKDKYNKVKEKYDEIDDFDYTYYSTPGLLNNPFVLGIIVCVVGMLLLMLICHL